MLAVNNLVGFGGNAGDPDIWSTDFSEYAVGVAPPDWSNIWNTTGTRVIESDGTAPGGKRLAINIGSSPSRTGYAWDTVPSVGDIDAVMLCAIVDAGGSSSYFRTGPVVRGAAGAATGYVGQFAQFGGSGGSNAQRRIRLFNGGSSSTLSSGSTMTWSFGERVWIRTRAWGTAISLKIWKDGDPEPVSFTTSATDATLASGLAGITAHDQNQDVQCFYFAAARNQKVAPLL